MGNYIDLLSGIFDTEQCIRYLKGIWENDRFFDYKSFAKTADYCANAMADIGLDQVEKLAVAADGKTAYGDWVLPQAWDVESAVLREVNNGASLTAGSNCSSDAWVLADYATTPCSLVMYSAKTPPGGITAECIMVDDLDKVTPEQAKGKLLFTGLPAPEVAKFAQEAGAAGIVSDYMRMYPGIRDSRKQLYDTSIWVNNFCVPINNTGLFAFSLSPRNGDKLRARLTAGESITLHAEVNTRAYDGEAYVVSGLIPGETDEEFCFYGHLYEPGAHDNASGCAAILELARCLNAAIKSGAIPKPKLSMRFIMGPECSGSMAYFTKHTNRKYRAGIVLDMVGTQSIDNAVLCIWHNPMSNVSLIDALAVAAIEDYAAKHGHFDWKSSRFSIGTDNILSDPCFGMPSFAMIAEPALSYHSSFDTPDRIEPDVIKRNGVMAGACALSMAYDEKGFGRACRVYKRKVMGCLTFDNRPDLQAKWQPAWNGHLNIPLFWMDGKRTIWEVAQLAASELRIDDVVAYFNEICEYAEFLQSEGYIELWKTDKS